MDIERLVIGAPFYMIILIVLVAALYPAAVALDRRRTRLAIAIGLAGIAIHTAYMLAVFRFARGYDGMTLLLVWPAGALLLSAILAIIIRRAAATRD